MQHHYQAGNEHAVYISALLQFLYMILSMATHFAAYFLEAGTLIMGHAPANRATCDSHNRKKMKIILQNLVTGRWSS